MDGKKSVIVDSESLADSDVEKQASAAAIQYRRQARQEDAASDELETLAVPSTPKSKSGLEAPIAAEYRTSTKTKYLFLGLYFSLSLILTIYSKAVLGKVRPHLGLVLQSADCGPLHSSPTRGFSRLYTQLRHPWAATC